MGQKMILDCELRMWMPENKNAAFVIFDEILKRSYINNNGWWIMREIKVCGYSQSDKKTSIRIILTLKSKNKNKTKLQ